MEKLLRAVADGDVQMVTALNSRVKRSLSLFPSRHTHTLIAMCVPRCPPLSLNLLSSRLGAAGALPVGMDGRGRGGRVGRGISVSSSVSMYDVRAGPQSK